MGQPARKIPVSPPPQSQAVPLQLLPSTVDSDKALLEWLTLPEIAYIYQERTGKPCTVAQVSGALRALKLHRDRTHYRTTVQGCVVSRHATFVEPSKLLDILHYLEARHGH